MAHTALVPMTERDMQKRRPAICIAAIYNKSDNLTGLNGFYINAGNCGVAFATSEQVASGTIGWMYNWVLMQHNVQICRILHLELWVCLRIVYWHAADQRSSMLG